MSELNKMQKRIVDFRDARDWKQFHNPKDMAISLNLEASELLEHFQWKDSEEISDHIKKNKPAIADELADVMYWVLLMANDMDVDITESFEKKMKNNEGKYSIEKAKGNHKKYTEL
jgi:NTP pyrophosphatase (non-canonical NTP hydrolase)